MSYIILVLERERLEIERTRMALEKEKQDQARELEQRQRRLAEEAKHRRQQDEARLREEKLNRLSNNDRKRPRSSHYESTHSHHLNPTSSSNSTKIYGRRSSTSNTASGREHNRSFNDISRDYRPETKRQHIDNSSSQHEIIL